jgi:enoyl-CoA hydratase/carnithine racemase
LDRLVGHENLVEEAMALAHQIAFWPPMAVRSSKRVLQQNLEVELAQALRNEVVGLSYARQSPEDQQESRQAWAQKRRPKFTGR